MNFVFISPQFPETYWLWCDRLRSCGASVYGIGDAPSDAISPQLRRALDEYVHVDSLENYDQVFRAVAYLSWKHGHMDWIESMNEHWLSSPWSRSLCATARGLTRAKRLGSLSSRTMSQQGGKTDGAGGRSTSIP